MKGYHAIELHMHTVNFLVSQASEFRTLSHPRQGKHDRHHSHLLAHLVESASLPFMSSHTIDRASYLWLRASCFARWLQVPISMYGIELDTLHSSLPRRHDKGRFVSSQLAFPYSAPHLAVEVIASAFKSVLLERSETQSRGSPYLRLHVRSCTTCNEMQYR
jgi:hypothetical protein